MTKDEALKLALEALNDLSAWNDGEVGGHMDEPYSAEVARRTIISIKEALAQEQEPLAWISTGPANMIHWTADKPAYGDDWVPLYTTPPQRKPLTESEIKHLWYEACQTNLELTSQLIVHLARNIEAAHGIKE